MASNFKTSHEENMWPRWFYKWDLPNIQENWVQPSTEFYIWKSRNTWSVFLRTVMSKLDTRKVNYRAGRKKGKLWGELHKGEFNVLVMVYFLSWVLDMYSLCLSKYCLIFTRLSGYESFLYLMIILLKKNFEDLFI